MNRLDKEIIEIYLFTTIVWLINYKSEKVETCEGLKGMRWYVVRGKRQDLLENVTGPCQLRVMVIWLSPGDREGIFEKFYVLLFS